MAKLVYKSKVKVESMVSLLTNGIKAIEEIEFRKNDGILIVIFEDEGNLYCALREQKLNSGASATNCMEFLIKYVRKKIIIHTIKNVKYYEWDHDKNFDEIMVSEDGKVMFKAINVEKAIKEDALISMIGEEAFRMAENIN